MKIDIKLLRIKNQNDLVLLNFNKSKNNMNELLDDISNKYEGIIQEREKHNFPLSNIPKNHKIYKILNKLIDFTETKYLIAIYDTNINIQYELLHAKYYIDLKYKNEIIEEWNLLDVTKKEVIINFFKNVGYLDDVIIDKYQAYKYSNKSIFF
jgi:hypothetical protein